MRLLRENAREMDLFGSGPHFVVTNDQVPVGSLRRIMYSLKTHPDHSAALTILDDVTQAVAPAVPPSVLVAENQASEPGKVSVGGVVPIGKTAYYISDLLPPDAFEEIKAKSSGEEAEIEGSFGLGFTVDEVPFRAPTALHDLTVGLILFR